MNRAADGMDSSRDPFAHIRLRFPDPQSAIEFAERQGWRYVVQDPPERRHSPKRYSEHFRYDLADAITRAAGRWDGAVSINGRRDNARRKNWRRSPVALPRRIPRLTRLG